MPPAYTAPGATKSNVAAVPMSATSSGVLLPARSMAPRAAARRSAPRVAGVAYRICIGMGVEAPGVPGQGPKAVLTGGGAEYILKNKLLSFDSLYDPHLVLRGLNSIIDYNENR